MILRVKPRPPAPRRAPASSARVQRRRERMRASLLAVGARQFAQRGIAPVSVEELIAEADVSRATFYGLFSSKYSLLEGILNPIFELATRRDSRRSLARPPEEAIDGLVDVYLVALDDASRRPAADSARRPGDVQALRTAASRAARCAARSAARRRARRPAAQRQRAVLAASHRAHGGPAAARLRRPSPRRRRCFATPCAACCCERTR